MEAHKVYAEPQRGHVSLGRALLFPRLYKLATTAVLSGPVSGLR